jgi:hypothetical protein
VPPSFQLSIDSSADAASCFHATVTQVTVYSFAMHGCDIVRGSHRGIDNFKVSFHIRSHPRGGCVPYTWRIPTPYLLSLCVGVA